MSALIPHSNPVDLTSGSAGVSNVVIISDVQERIPNILKMVEELDQPIANVNIAVRFIESGVETINAAVATKNSAIIPFKIC